MERNVLEYIRISGFILQPESMRVEEVFVRGTTLPWKMYISCMREDGVSATTQSDYYSINTSSLNCNT